jgi:hypothetical protein
VKAARIVIVPVVEASTKEVTATWESTAALVRDAENWASMVEREARERVSIVEAESAIVLASAFEEAEGLAHRIVLLEGERTEENFQCLSDATADA